TLEVRSGDSRLYVVRDRVEIDGLPGEYVSLIPWSGAAEGVTTNGLRWPLTGGRLEQGSSRGISNELLGDAATIEVKRGVLLVVLPVERSPLNQVVPDPD